MSREVSRPRADYILVPNLRSVDYYAKLPNRAAILTVKITVSFRIDNPSNKKKASLSLLTRQCTISVSGRINKRSKLLFAQPNFLFQTQFLHLNIYRAFSFRFYCAPRGILKRSKQTTWHDSIKVWYSIKDW